MLQHTTNETTVQVGQCVATLISYLYNSETDTTAYTFELVYPRIIHSEFMTHRMFSRNAMSSRATPVKTMLNSLDEEHYVPKEFLKNQSGMVGGEPLSEEDQKFAKGYWESAYYRTREIVASLNNLGVHKQYINRLLEPFAFIKVIVTATEWDNFFKLRLAPDAQPEIQDLAKAIKESMGLKDKLELISIKNLVSAPYIKTEDLLDIYTMFPSAGYIEVGVCIACISMARCARVSYYKHDGTAPSIVEDLKLAKRLLASGHLTPSEHIVYPLLKVEYERNLKGFTSLRTLIEEGNNRQGLIDIIDNLLD